MAPQVRIVITVYTDTDDADEAVNRLTASLDGKLPAWWHWEIETTEEHEGAS